MVTKKAVFDYKDQERIREACDTDRERVILMLMLDFGMHPKNLTELRPTHLDDGWLHYARAKNKRPMDFLIHPDMIEALKDFLKKPKRKERTYNLLVHEIGDRIGMPELSPMSLRKTTCINILRLYDDIDFAATWMGCTRETVRHHYMMLKQWEAFLSAKQRTAYEKEIKKKQLDRAKERG